MIENRAARCLLKRGLNMTDGAMLKVAIIIERAEIALGGAERSVSELTAELRQQGIEATLLAAKGKVSEHTRILCGSTGGKRTSLKQFEKAIRQHLQQHYYDIIHSTLPLSIADVYQPRGGSYQEAMQRNIASYPSALQRCFKRWTHWLNVRRSEYILAERRICSPEHVTLIAALSDYVRRQFREHYQLQDKRIAVIPNGINTPLLPDERAAAKLKETICNSITIPQGKTATFFLFAATNPRLKGCRPLLRAFGKLRDNTDVYPVLVIAGAKNLEGFEEVINQYGLQNHLVSLGKLDEIRNAVSVCDVAVLPTYYDPCSRFILEALAMGKPVITTRFNGASERYEHRKHGIVIDDPNDYRTISEAIAYFCDPQKIQLAHEAIVEDNLIAEISIKRHVEKLIDLYQAIMAKKSI